MKKVCVIVTALLITINCFSQAMNWAWAKRAGGSGYDSPNNIGTDASGNVYVVGQFSADTISFGITDLLNLGDFDIFLVKYSPSGNVIWAKRAGGNNRELAYGIAIDVNSNIYITGYFRGPSSTFDTITLTNPSNYFTDIFLAKYDSSGNVIWAKSFGGTDEDEDFAVTTDGNSNVYLTGYFKSPSIVVGNDTLILSNGSVFVAKFDSSGNEIWVKQLVANDTRSIATDVSGNIYIAGTFGNAGATIGTVNLTSSGQGDVFFAKLNSMGNIIWAKSAGGSSYDYATKIVVDNNNNIIIGGYFQSPTITFGTSILTNVNPSTVAGGQGNIFLVKYDTLGSLFWAKSAGGMYWDGLNSMATDAMNNIYLTGYYNAPSVTFSTITLTSPNLNLFVAAYDSIGNVIWAKSQGGTDIESGLGICTDANQNVYVCGFFNSPSIAFGSDTLFNLYSVVSGNNPDLFIAKLTSTTGINELTVEDNGITISPNPFTSQTTITFSSEQKNTTLKVMDVVGKDILKQVMNDTKTATLDMSGYAKGIYFVEIITSPPTSAGNGNVVNRKIVIQ